MMRVRMKVKVNKMIKDENENESDKSDKSDKSDENDSKR